MSTEKGEDKKVRPELVHLELSIFTAALKICKLLYERHAALFLWQNQHQVLCSVIERKQLGSNPLFKAGAIRSGGTGLYPAQFSKDKDPMTSLVMCSSVWAPSQWKHFLWNWSLLWSSLHALHALHPGKSHPLHFSIKQMKRTVRFALQFLSSRLKLPNFLSLSLCTMYFNPLVILVVSCWINCSMKMSFWC